jgi:hypothetical protein
LTAVDVAPELAGSAAARLPPYSALDEPSLVFGRGRSSDIHPLRGLLNHGPYSSSSFPRFSSEIRVATIGPRSGIGRVRNLVDGLFAPARANDRNGYVLDYPGFTQVFGVGIRLAEHPATQIVWPDDALMLGANGTPEQRVGQAIQHAMSSLAALPGEFDVVAVHLPDSWDSICRARDFDAHHFVKAEGAFRAIPTQVLNDRVFSFGYPAQRSWRLGIAMYVKAGGIPWKLAPLAEVPENTAYIGLAYALRGDPREARFVTCCSQVFDTDGGGMQFVAYDASDPVADEHERHNPHLSRADMRAVMAGSLRTYQARNGGLVPRRVVVHKLTPFREDELDGVCDALSPVDEIECIQITSDLAWRAVWRIAPRSSNERSTPDRYPVHRGTMLPMSGTSCLLWAAGSVDDISTRGSFYQGQKSIPRPILLQRQMGHGPLELAALEALALTKMDWNNDALYDPLPVTIQYSRRLARSIASIPSLLNTEYPYRMFM